MVISDGMILLRYDKSNNLLFEFRVTSGILAFQIQISELMVSNLAISYGILYLDQWNYIAGVIDYSKSGGLSTKQTLYDENNYSTATCSGQYKEAANSIMSIGCDSTFSNGFIGYIYEISLSYTSETLANILLDFSTSCTGSCLYCPISSLACISTCANPQYPDSCNSACPCENGFSCSNSNVSSCITCNLSCPKACSGASSSDCIDLSLAYCKGHPYSPTKKSCLWTVSCPLNCYYCEDNNLCIKCNSGYAVWINSCAKCNKNCVTCSGPSPNQCLTCVATGITPSATGTCSCAVGEYQISSSPLTCGLCDSSCSSCVGAGLGDCLACSDPAIIITSPPGYCTCGVSQYTASSNPLICENCDSSCLSCTGPLSNQCIACKNSTITLSSIPNSCSCLPNQSTSSLSPLTCVDQCSSNQFILSLNPLSCGDCSAPCASCISLGNDQCLSCVDSSITPNTLPGSCLCNSSQYIIKKSPLLCGNCDSSCLTCSGPLSTDCIACRNNSITLSSFPSSCSCSSSQYIISLNPLTCGFCHSSCLSCTGPYSYDCLLCKDIEITLNNIPGSCTCKSDQYIIQKAPLLCGKCDDNCSICTGSTNNDCIKCTNFSITPASIPGSCACETSEFVITNSPLSCGSCNYDCLSCIGPQEDQCLSCKDLIVIQETPGRCSCSKSEYLIDSSPLSCGKCDPSCFSCIGPAPNQCTSCTNQSITPSSPIGYCNCLPSQYIMSSSPLICGDCNINCSSCSAPDKCLSCKNSTISPNSEGNCNCKDSEYIISLSPLMCGSCDSRCETCIGPWNHDCLTCKNSSISLNKAPSSCRTAAETNENSLNELSSKGGAYVSAGVVFSGFALSLLTGKTGFLWTYLNIIQILAFIPLQNIDIPDCLFHFWKAFLSYVFLPNFGKIIYGKSEIERHSPIYRWHKYGYTSSSFLANGGGMIFIIFIVVFIWAIIILISFYPEPALQKKMRLILEKFKFSIYIRLWMEIYIFLMAAAVIGINNLSIDDIPMIFDSIFSILWFSLGLFSIIYFSYILYINRHKIPVLSSKFSKKYGSLFEEFYFEDSIFDLMYYPCYLLRRISYVVILYDLSSAPAIQCLLNSFHSFMITFFLLRSWRFKDKECWILNIAGEIIILVSFMLSGIYMFEISDIANFIIQIIVFTITIIYLISSYFILIFKLYHLIKLKHLQRNREIIPEVLSMNCECWTRRSTICLDSDKNRLSIVSLDRSPAEMNSNELVNHEIIFGIECASPSNTKI